MVSFYRCLLLMTRGLYGALEEATENDLANREIAQIVVDQFSSQVFKKNPFAIDFIEPKSIISAVYRAL